MHIECSVVLTDQTLFRYRLGSSFRCYIVHLYSLTNNIVSNALVLDAYSNGTGMF